MGNAKRRTDGNMRKLAAACLLVFAALFSFMGCASVVKGQMQEVKAPNRIFLHDNPQAGDYALYENGEGTHQMKREIAAVHGDTVEIRTTFPKTPEIIAVLQSISFRSLVRLDGTVIEAYMHDARSGKTTPLALARRGDYNYLDENDFKTLPVPETIATRKGSYQINRVIVFNQTTNILGVETKLTSVWYYDRSVKFGLVRQYNLMESDASIVEVAAFINKLSPVPQLYRSLNSYIIEKSRHHTYTSQMDLVETN